MIHQEQAGTWPLANAHVDLLISLFPDSADILRWLRDNKDKDSSVSQDHQERCQLALMLLSERQAADKDEWPYSLQWSVKLDDLQGGEALNSPSQLERPNKGVFGTRLLHGKTAAIELLQFKDQLLIPL